MNAIDTHISETSQRELAAGVLKQAEQDLRRFHDAASAIERELYLDAYRWVMSDDYTWPFSFLTVCESLNLVAEDVRQDLTGHVSLGTFSRWAPALRSSSPAISDALIQRFANPKKSEGR